MMIYAVINENSRSNEHLFNSFEEFTATLIENPEAKLECSIMLDTPKGKTYQEKKSYIESAAIDLSNNRVGGLYWSEELDLQDYFEYYGGRYGLLTDFHENAIC